MQTMNGEVEPVFARWWKEQNPVRAMMTVRGCEWGPIRYEPACWFKLKVQLND